MPATPVLRTPDDFLAAIPTMLGFHPTDALVVVVTRGETVEVTARWDLTPVALHAGTQWLSRRVRDAPAHPQDGPVRVFLAGYGDPESAVPGVTQRVLYDPAPMTVSRAVTLAVLLDDEHVRSTVYTGWTPGQADAASDRLVAAAELLPDDPRIGGLLGCAGLGAWVSGNTVTMRAFLDRAERVAPDHEETGFLRDLVDSDLSPSQWTDIRAAHWAVTHAEPTRTRDDAIPSTVTTPTRDHVGLSV